MKLTPDQIEQLTKLLPEICRQQDAIERTNRYDMVGPISGISFTGTCSQCALRTGVIDRQCKSCQGTGRGYIDFPAERAALAYSQPKRNPNNEAIIEPGGVILIAGQWPGAAPVRDVQPEVCTDCAVPCPECDATGARQCTLCGGEGEYNPQPTECPAAGCAKEKGKYNKDCTECGGSGIKMVKEQCPQCEGKKVSPCGGCLASGKMPTGMTQDLQVCPSCNGNKRKQSIRQQDLTPHILCEAGPYLVLGPVEIFYLHRKGFIGKNGACRLTAEPDPGGNPMMLVITQRHAGGRAYIVSGQFKRTDLEQLNEATGSRFGS
jgi:hypothetical protein